MVVGTIFSIGFSVELAVQLLRKIKLGRIGGIGSFRIQFHTLNVLRRSKPTFFEELGFVDLVLQVLTDEGEEGNAVLAKVVPLLLTVHLGTDVAGIGLNKHQFFVGKDVLVVIDGIEIPKLEIGDIGRRIRIDRVTRFDGDSAIV